MEDDIFEKLIIDVGKYYGLKLQYTSKRFPANYTMVENDSIPSIKEPGME
jgi:hypothetical protein